MRSGTGYYYEPPIT